MRKGILTEKELHALISVRAAALGAERKLDYTEGVKNEILESVAIIDALINEVRYGETPPVENPEKRI